MDRLTTDNPKNNVETMRNMLYDVDGWAYIRHGENGMLVQDFVLGMCEQSGCDMGGSVAGETPERKDEFLCECVFENCPYADTYAALCGYSAIRNRLKMYEDAGMTPPKQESVDKVFYFAVKDGCVDPETGETDEAGLRLSTCDVEGIDSADDAIRFVEKQLPVYAGRLRQITEEEYLRDYGDDE